jgi:serine/threonine protein kinase
MNIVVASEYEDFRAWLMQMPRLFDDNQGELLYRGRNQIRLFDVDGRKLVVKRFKRNDIIKAVVYTLFRKNKARRSYENAGLLRQRGFVTPHEVAYIEQRTAGLVTQVYYVCAYTDGEPIRPRLIEQEPFDERLATDYARYVASLHESGVLHRDLNPTNVLFSENGEPVAVSFELIDINRMQFFDGAVPKAACMENLTLFYWLTPAYRFILNEYARQRGWSEADVAEAIRVKQRHDRRWIRRKRLTHPFRK